MPPRYPTPDTQVRRGRQPAVPDTCFQIVCALCPHPKRSHWPHCGRYPPPLINNFAWCAHTVRYHPLQRGPYQRQPKQFHPHDKTLPRGRPAEPSRDCPTVAPPAPRISDSRPQSHNPRLSSESFTYSSPIVPDDTSKLVSTFRSGHRHSVLSY